jgi:predicted dehydrogenase
MEPVRIGVIGCGVIGTGAHLPTCARSELLECVAVADLIPERVAAAAERFGVPKTYPSGLDLLADREVEVVILALPAGVRTPLARAALKAGKHVLIEKPIASNVAEVRELIALRGGLTAGCCSSRMRWTPSARAATACLASGALGELRVVRARAVLPAGPAPTSPPPPWRASFGLNGGGILVNWGCYDLDYLLGICDWQLRPESVLAQWWPVAEHLRARVDPASDADNHFIALIRCAGGSVISFERGEFTAASRDEAWQIIGSRGSLSLWLHSTKGKELRLDTTDAEAGVRSQTLWSGDEDGADHNRGVLEDFAHAVRAGGQPSTSLERAFVMQAVTDAIYESARSGASAAVATLE